MKRFILYALVVVVLFVASLSGAFFGVKMAAGLFIPQAHADPQTEEPPLFGVARDKIPPGEHYVIKGMEFAPPFSAKRCIRVLHVTSGNWVSVECQRNDWIYLVRPEK